MGEHYTLSLIEILRKTLLQLEDSEKLARTDPAYLRLTHQITRLIAELELAKEDRQAA